MRSSRRTLGLQPELVPEESESEEESQDEEINSRENAESDTEINRLEDKQQSAIDSNDVNIDDSNVSDPSSGSDSIEDVTKDS